MYTRHASVYLTRCTPAPADVYAMGVLLWEAYSGDRVFKQLSDSEVILAVVTRKARPQFPPDTPQRWGRQGWGARAGAWRAGRRRPGIAGLLVGCTDGQDCLVLSGPCTP